ncbi:MAG: tripartite tricarboxylate transporter substrate binding protein [Burkholderiales bacterium]|nr:tripartite tricarboxylate transporter substrate binding protein [Burkholderiales bacterium]
MARNDRRRVIAGLAGAAASLSTASLPLRAQTSESKPLSIVVPYAPGGTASDAFARMLASGMSPILNRNVIVENRPGGNGIIAATHVARSPADGSTILMGGTGPVSLNVMMRPSLAFNLDSFQSVAMLFDGMLTLTVASRLKVNNVNELVEYAKKHGPLRYGTFGPGSVSELYGLMLTKRLGMPLIPVPYRSNAAAITDMIGGSGDFSVATPISLVEFQKRGDLKILALTTEKRDPSFPDIPCVAELGYPDLIASYWTALHAPKGTPMETVRAISNAALQVVQSKSFRDLLATNGQTLKAGGPEALDAQLEWDRRFWGRIIKENNIVLNG